MFEFLMLVGFLGAGLCHWHPRVTGGEGTDSEEKEAKRGKAGDREKGPGGKTLRARIAAA